LSRLQELQGTEYHLLQQLAEDDRKYRVVTNRYATGGVSIDVQVLEKEGYWEPEARLTYNLGPEDLQEPYTLADNEIFVKSDMVKYFKMHLGQLGFVYSKREIGYGPYDRKAQVWVLKGEEDGAVLPDSKLR